MYKSLGTNTIKTERLILSKYELDDYTDAYNNWCKEDVVAKYVTWEAHKSFEETKEFIKSEVDSYGPDTYKWIVRIKETNEAIGGITVVHLKKNDLRAELGYCYGSKYWGNGYATEALKAVINYLFNKVGLELIVIDHMAQNPASGRVMQKAGLHYVATLPKWIIDKEGKRDDLVFYQIFKGE